MIFLWWIMLNYKVKEITIRFFRPLGFWKPQGSKKKSLDFKTLNMKAVKAKLGLKPVKHVFVITADLKARFNQEASS